MFKKFQSLLIVLAICFVAAAIIASVWKPVVMIDPLGRPASITCPNCGAKDSHFYDKFGRAECGMCGEFLGQYAPDSAAEEPEPYGQ